MFGRAEWFGWAVWRSGRSGWGRGGWGNGLVLRGRKELLEGLFEGDIFGVWTFKDALNVLGQTPS